MLPNTRNNHCLGLIHCIIISSCCLMFLRRNLRCKVSRNQKREVTTDMTEEQRITPTTIYSQDTVRVFGSNAYYQCGK
jgi:hypothetical protein